MTDRKPDENLMNSPVWEAINRTLHILMFFRMTCLFSMDFSTEYMLSTLWFRMFPHNYSYIPVVPHKAVAEVSE